MRVTRSATSASAKPTRTVALDTAAAGKKLEKLYEAGKLQGINTAPDVKGLKGFAVKDLDARAMGDSITSARAWVDARKGKVYLRVSGVERLPWEGIESRFTQWYSVPLATLKR